MRSVLVSCALLVFVPPSLLATSGPGGTPRLSADQIIARAVARTESPQKEAASLVCKKVTDVDELDASGNVKEHQEKVYQMQFRSGQTFLKLLSINGQPPPKSEMKQTAENDSTLRRLLGQKDNPNSLREGFLTREVASHFRYTDAGETVLHGRKTYMVNFRPKPDAPEHRLVDRLLNRLSGKLWIDATEFEVARVDLRLRSEVGILAGILGVLRKMDYSLTRTRQAAGVWVSTYASGEFEGRKFLNPRHVRMKTQTTDFRPLA